MAAKRYRDAEHRSFRRHAGYTEGRRLKDTREARAVATKTRFGRQVATDVWAQAEWTALVDLWTSGEAHRPNIHFGRGGLYRSPASTRSF